MTGTLLRLLAVGNNEAFLTNFRCSTKAFLLTLHYKHELTPGARIKKQCKWVNSIQNPNSLSSFAVNFVFFGAMLEKKKGIVMAELQKAAQSGVILPYVVHKYNQ